MNDLQTLSLQATINVVLTQPTGRVATAVRAGASSAGDVALDDAARAAIVDLLEAATGSREWSLEQLRDPRPFAEFLEVARLIRAQRVVTTAAAAAIRRPRPQPHALVRGRAAGGQR